MYDSQQVFLDRISCLIQEKESIFQTMCKDVCRKGWIDYRSGNSNEDNLSTPASRKSIEDSDITEKMILKVITL